VPDGAYEAMVGAIRAGRGPNLFLLGYSLPFTAITSVLLPKHFLVEPIVIRRRPLSAGAHRAGWVECNLDLKLLPRSAFVQYVIDGNHRAQACCHGIVGSFPNNRRRFLRTVARNFVPRE